MQLTSGFAEAEHWKGKPQGYSGVGTGTGKPKSRGGIEFAIAVGDWSTGDPIESSRQILRGRLTEPMPILYRGIRVSDVDRVNMDTFMSAHMPGSTVDMDIQSFSSRLDVAENFSHRGREPGDSSGSIVFKLSKGGTGMNLSAKLTHDTQDEFEWITGGRFKVGHIIDTPGHDRQVELTQVAVLGG